MTTRAMFAVCASAAVVLWAGSTAAVGPDEKCQALKNKDTGKLAACLQKAEMKLVKTKGLCGDPLDQECYRESDCNDACVKDTVKYAAAIGKCTQKFLSSWAKDELKGDGSCPDGIADPNSMLDFVMAHCDAVAGALAGDGLLTDVEACNSDLQTCEGDLGTCQGDLGTCNTDLVTCQSDLADAEDCGNGVLDAGEDCDFGELNGATCESRGFVEGALRCGGGCVYDESECVARRVFVTSTTQTGNLGGLSGADALCQGLADGASGGALGGTWVAWLSTDSVDARDRIPDAAYRLVDGTTLIVRSKADLLDGSILHAIDLDQNGVAISTYPTPRQYSVHTGTLVDGTAATGPITRNCSGWTDGSGGVTTWAGECDYQDTNWTDTGVSTLSCSNHFRLYCFEE